ncbi:MAG TPA: ArsR family transcriptional regulator [Caldithrix abyssi]|uniref:ArsR family transcriptional regulator n=1 Tax=Caldithrix abyssi TaxID=187145 RepID=A0A7V5H2V6_CALAY|nr:ArsR family transcriptional regulator [Caldithrix abyssi]
MRKKNYFVIIGDIVQSRQIKKRAQVQKIFAQAIADLERNFNDSFLSPPTLTIGDEFQAVLQSTQDLFMLVHQFEIAMEPVQVRFGLGLGQIETPINRQAAIGMDGSAFHYAREAIEQARLQNRKYLLITAMDEIQHKALELLLRWIDLNLQTWSIEKLKILTMHRQGKRQKEIANSLKMSQPAISQHLSKPVFSLIMESELFLESQLNSYLKG